MKSYTSFLIRCWLIRSAPDDGRCIFDIEQAQTGEHLRTDRSAKLDFVSRQVTGCELLALEEDES